MKKSSVHILHHFYSLLLEMNFYEGEDETLTPENYSDPFLQKHLRLIKLKIAKNKATLKRNSFQTLLKEIENLRKIGVDELNKFLTPKEALQLQPLFNKFELLSNSDKESIAEDEELLQLLDSLKDKVDKSNRNE